MAKFVFLFWCRSAFEIRV